jgi:hypothetical protein
MTGKGRRVMDQIGRRDAHVDDLTDTLPIKFPPLCKSAGLHGSVEIAVEHGSFSSMILLALRVGEGRGFAISEQASRTTAASGLTNS